MDDFRTGGYCPSCLHEIEDCRCLELLFNSVPKATIDTKPLVVSSAPIPEDEEYDDMEYQGCIECGRLDCDESCFEPEW